MMNVDTLLIAIVQNQDADAAMTALNQMNVGVTRISSVGGFLEMGNVTLLVGLRCEQIGHVIAALKRECHSRTIFVNASPQASLFIAPVEAEVGGATLFALPIEHALQLSQEHFEMPDFQTQENPRQGMKLIVAIVPETKAPQVVGALTSAGYRATRISTSGGFWRRGNATLLIGIEAHWVNAVLTQIQNSCRNGASTASETNATVFVLDVERFERL